VSKKGGSGKRNTIKGERLWVGPFIKLNSCTLVEVLPLAQMAQRSGVKIIDPWEFEEDTHEPQMQRRGKGARYPSRGK